MSTTKMEFVHQPKTIDEMVLHTDVKVRLVKALEDIPNIMLIGSPGVGKGTWVDILRKTYPDSACMKLNGSDERGIDIFRNRIKPFCSTPSLDGSLNIMYINECLEEHEEIRLSNGEFIKLCDIDGEVSILSFNMETSEIEKDTAVVIKKSIDDVYEVELDDGRKIKCNDNHPFLVREANGIIIERKLKDLAVGDDIVTI